MKKKLLAALAIMLLATVALSSCSVLNNVMDFINGIIAPSVELDDAALSTEKLVDFKDGAKPDVLFESDGWTNGDVFNVVWKKHNVFYEDGTMRLGITEEKATAWLDDAEVEYNYTAGEARTQNYYHYGDYEVSMKPSANPGTASTFFVCTGPYDLKNGVPNAHDEIDIEFLGNDTTHVQFNFFVDGKGGNEYMYDLGFDASEEFHTYGFRWEPNAITWFVDGEPVYKVTTDTSVQTAGNLKVVPKLPSTAGRILTNYWCGNQDAWAWMGEYKGSINDNGTVYQWIGTSAEGAPLNPPENPPVDDVEIKWDEIESLAPNFPNAGNYVVTTDGNKANVTYTDVAGNSYIPLEMDVTDAVAGKNFLHLKVTNNGSETVNVRVNMFDPTLTGNNKATNISATMNGVAVRTDLDWGGSFFDIPAGEIAELVVQFGVGGNKLQLMIDSSTNEATLRSGDITVDEIKFTTVGEVEAPHSCKDTDGDDICDECGKGMIVPPSVTDPVSGNLTLDFGGFTTTIGGNVTDGYGVNVDENNNIKVVYTNIQGDSYKNIWANVSAIAATKTAFTAKITNPGAKDVTVRVDIESETKTSANTTCCNDVATMNGVEVYTDKEWGGSTFVVPAGATVEIVVNYDASAKPTNVKIMIDSSMYGDKNIYAGEITISDINFTGEYTPSDDPVTPPAPSYEYNDLYVEFKTENNYTLVSPDTYANSVRVTYTDIAQNSWNNINIWVEDKSADCTIFSMKLTNHGSAQVSVWVQMKDAAGAELINENKNIAAGAEEVFTFTYTGTAQMIFFFVDSTHEAAAGPNAGDITISEIKLGKVKAEEPPVVTPVEGEYLSYKGNECYTLSATEADYVNTINVTYTNVSDNTYQNVNTWIRDKASGKTTLGVTIKNNGAETVNITIKLENGAGENTETKVVLEAGKTYTASLAYSFAPDLLYFFIDSGWSETTSAHAGDITISGVNFS